VLRETNRKRGLIPLPFFAAKVIGALAQIPAALGLKPVLTEDQVLLLQADNVVAADAEGLAALDIQPTGVEAIAPSYLWRYRRGGQFAESPAAA
jgi:NADH dehydrogenase